MFRKCGAGTGAAGGVTFCPGLEPEPSGRFTWSPEPEPKYYPRAGAVKKYSRLLVPALKLMVFAPDMTEMVEIGGIYINIFTASSTNAVIGRYTKDSVLV